MHFYDTLNMSHMWVMTISGCWFRRADISEREGHNNQHYVGGGRGVRDKGGRQGGGRGKGIHRTAARPLKIKAEMLSRRGERRTTPREGFYVLGSSA